MSKIKQKIALEKILDREKEATKIPEPMLKDALSEKIPDKAPELLKYRVELSSGITLYIKALDRVDAQNKAFIAANANLDKGSPPILVTKINTLK